MQNVFCLFIFYRHKKAGSGDVLSLDDNQY